MTPKQTSALFAVALAAAIALLYSFSINNQLVFDDERLIDGTIFGQYGNLMELKVRSLSAGSFVWLQSILGEGWWKQRVFNIALHIGTALTLYALVLVLLVRTPWGEDRINDAFFRSLQNAARAGVALWALNPVAVYAVAYLIQRSILMATLFVVMGCLSYVRGVVTGRWAWHLLAFVSYILAVASKEHAVTAILLTVPLFVFVKRPTLLRILQVSGLALLVVGLAGSALYSQYSHLIGNLFDLFSQTYAQQLEAMQPGIRQHLYPLSILNQASLFFHYGFLWFVPFVGWMSIDLRPEFPVSYLGWQSLGAAAWLGTLAGSAWLVVRGSAGWRLAGLAVQIPLLLFLTEFATIWIQDPLVLYRSYLWSMGVPILIAALLVGRHHRQTYAVVAVAMAALVASSYERIVSLRTPIATWTDASAKVDLQAPANAVGRWRPFLNLGEVAVDRGDYNEALRLFALADSLGNTLGETARLRARITQMQQLEQMKLLADKLANPATPERMKAGLYLQLGESQYAQQKFAEAFDSFSSALTQPQSAADREQAHMRQAESAVASQKYDAAIAAYQRLIKDVPDNQRYQVGLSMAYIGKANYAAALTILNPTIIKNPSEPAFYARALTFYYMGKRTESAQDLAVALRTAPNNPMYRQLQTMLNTPSARPTSSP